MNYTPIIITLVALVAAIVVATRIECNNPGTLKKVMGNLLSWTWTKSVLFWIIISAGTFSELAFLLASIWMSVNATEHSFILMFMQQLQSEEISYLAKSAYVVLPVCILPLGIVTTFSHIKTWLYVKKFWCPSMAWTILYGLPTATFLVIDLCIIGNSDAKGGYVLPDFLVQSRAIMAYAYGLIAIIYHFVGKAQEADRLKEKDDLIEALHQEYGIKLSDSSNQVNTLKAEMENLKRLISQEKNEKVRLQSEIIKQDETALAAYSQECINWLSSGIKTVSIEDITRYSGHSKRKIQAAITGGNLQTATRNKELIIVSSLTEWLKNNQPPANKTERNTDKIISFREVEKEAVNG